MTLFKIKSAPHKIVIPIDSITINISISFSDQEMYLHKFFQ